MKKIIRILSLMTFMSMITSQACLAVSYATEQYAAVIVSLMAATTVTTAVNNKLHEINTQKAKNVDTGFCKNPTLMKELLIREVEEEF